MKNLFLLWATIVSQTLMAQNVGIGTAIPLARLHVADSSVLFSAVGFTAATPGLPPVQGPGRRTMWYADKAAFRTGYVEGPQWDMDSIGRFSFANGYNTKAKGLYSTAMGINTTASGNASTAIGAGSVANATGSIAMGFVSIASGVESIAMGEQAVASGLLSIAIGAAITAKSGFETVLGRFNTDYTPINVLGWDPSDRLFSIGNGESVLESDAMVVLKNGNTGFGLSIPNATLEVVRGTGSYGTAAFHGTNHISHFNYGTDEDTYIRAGKDNRNVILNDIPGGKVGIGMGNPNSPLSFASNTGKKISLYESAGDSHYGFSIQAAQLQIYSDAPTAKISFGYYNSGTYTERMYLTNSTGILTVAGTNYPSDARYKKQITRLQHPLEKIMGINGVEYFMRTDEFPAKHFDDKLQVGLIAQEVEKVLPQVVQTSEDGYKAIDYAKMVPLLVEGIKEQQEQIEKQQLQINDLKKIVEKLLKLCDK